MLPFLKNRDDGVGSGPVETKQRKPDGGGAFDLLDAVADDIIAAVKAGDKAMLKGALEALVEHIQSEDESQDAELGET